jgi:hypothetical protein
MIKVNLATSPAATPAICHEGSRRHGSEYIVGTPLSETTQTGSGSFILSVEIFIQGSEETGFTEGSKELDHVRSHSA